MDIIEGPNKKALTVAFNTPKDLMRFQRIILPRSDIAQTVSPFAKQIFSRMGDAIRVDFVKDSGQTQLSVIRKLLEWPDDQKKRFTDFVRMMVDTNARFVNPSDVEKFS